MAALVIDISTKQPVKDEPKTPVQHEPKPDGAAPDRKVTMEPQAFDACKHRRMSIDDKQRTVKCSDCGIWLDPVWCLHELFHYYETRVDHRIADIKAFEEREAKKAANRKERKRRPRASLLAQRHRDMERAAYNEYQSKLLSLRAERQRASIARIEKELGIEPEPSSDEHNTAAGA